MKWGAAGPLLAALFLVVGAILVPQQFGAGGTAGAEGPGSGAESNPGEAAESDAAMSGGRPLPPKSPFRDSVTYDPSSCSPPVADGRVWVMLGRLVLAWPADRIDISLPLPREEVAALPPPPDPSEPEGCPNNPMWSKAFTLIFPYPGRAQDGSQQREWAAADIIFVSPDFYGTQPLNEKTAERRCDRAPPGSIKRVLPIGFTVCRYKPDVDIPISRWSTSFVADADVYRTPDGQPFIISCLSGELTSEPYGCRVLYKAFPTVNVDYKIRFERTAIDEVIALDMALRRQMNQALIEPYPWPDLLTAESDEPGGPDD